MPKEQSKKKIYSRSNFELPTTPHNIKNQAISIAQNEEGGATPRVKLSMKKDGHPSLIGTVSKMLL